MDRQTAIERHFNNSLRKTLLEVMDVLEPGQSLKWGAKKEEELIAYAAMSLAMEYQSLTGMPVVDLMLDKFPTAANMPVPNPAPTPDNQITNVEGLSTATLVEDALPL